MFCLSPCSCDLVGGKGSGDGCAGRCVGRVSMNAGPAGRAAPLSLPPSVSRSVSLSVSLCVCVNHLNRCKTSTCRRCFSCFVFHDFLNVSIQGFSFCQIVQAGGHSISLGLCPTKLPVKWDIQFGQLDVPALVIATG